MNAKLIHAETARDIAPGATLHGCTGSAAGKSWRFEDIHACPTEDSSGLVHVSRTSKIGRDHRTLPPHMFNTKIINMDLDASVTFKGHFEATAKQTWQAFVTLVVAGIVAYIVAVGMQAMFHV